MKRNNLFMVAYIIFIFICVAVRLFAEFPQWQLIVVAITATSWIFSLADFNYTVANEIRIISKDNLEFSEPNIENIQKMLNAIDVILDNSKDGTPEATEKTNYYNCIRQSAVNCIEDYRKLKSGTKRNNLLASIAAKLASTLTVVGFVSFFAIMSFDKFSKVFINQQDIMTVTAFGLILFTQYKSEIAKEERKKYKESAEQLSNRWNELREAFELEVSSHAD